MRRRMDESPFGVLGQFFEARAVSPAVDISSSSNSAAVPVHIHVSSTSARPVLYENLLDIGKSQFPSPCQWCRPRLVTGQVGRGSAV
jgi:hypothetical protein